MVELFVSRYSPFFVFSFFFFTSFPFETLAAEPPFSFSFKRFEKNASLVSEIVLFGDAEIRDDMVRITRPGISSTGRVIYKKPIKFFGRSPGFSTYFSFSISPAKGDGLAFSVVPNNVPRESKDGHLLELSPSVLAVEFNTSIDPKSDVPHRNRIGVVVSSHISVITSGFSNASLVLNNGEKLHSWIDYDGDSRSLEVRLSKSEGSRPAKSLISYPLDLSGVFWKEAMFVSISASSGNSTQTSSVNAWSFAVKHAAPYLMHSEPLDPQLFLVNHEALPIHRRRNYLSKILMALVFGAACGALVAVIVLFVWPVVVDRRPVAPVEYPVQSDEFGYEKVVLVGDKRVVTATK